MAGDVWWWGSPGKLLSFRKIPKITTIKISSFTYGPDQHMELLFIFYKLFS